MSTYTLKFTVHARPVRWERTGQNKFAGGHSFEKREVKAGKADVARAFEDALDDRGYPDQAFPWQGPCKLKLTAVFQKPKTWYPGLECVKTPDLDNLAKLVQDALNGVAYRDDRQLVSIEVHRVYGDREHSEIELAFWEQPPKPAAPPRQPKAPTRPKQRETLFPEIETRKEPRK